jgi:hypothetical protein
MYAWTVDGGDNQLFTQWFWFRVGDTGSEVPLHSLALLSYTQPSTGFLTATYADRADRFHLTVTYELQGQMSGSGRSQLREAVTIRNSSAAPLDFHFFQYTDFDLGGTPAGEVGLISGPAGGGFDRAAVSTSRSWFVEAIEQHTSLAPLADRGEVDTYPATYDKLNDAGADILNGQTSATNDVTYAFQWDLTLAAGSSTQITKFKSLTLVPEPSALSLVSLTGAALLLSRRRHGLEGSRLSGNKKPAPGPVRA